MGECFELWLFVHVFVCVLNIIIRSPACHMHIYIFYDYVCILIVLLCTDMQQQY